MSPRTNTSAAAPPRPLSVDEAAGRAGFSPNHVRRLISAGRLRSVRYGRMVRILEADLDDYLRNGDDGAAANPRPGRAGDER